MANKKDLKALGELYGNLGKETTVVAEKVDKLTVGDEKASIGEADLEDGGGTEKGGFEESEVDITKVAADKNPYNIKGVSYGDDNSPTLETDQPKVVKPGEKGYEETEGEEDEESEESLPKELEIAKEGLNKYMAKKSIFDELYAKVISEDFGMEEVDDLDALGIDDATPDSELADDDIEEVGDEITVTLDKELAKTLCDLLQAAIGDEDTDEDADVEGDLEEIDDQFDPEEDNEGAPVAHTTHVDMGANNKVGHVDGLGGSGAGTANDGTIAHKLTATVKDGKSNKVGNLAQGKAAIGDLKVQPMNKVAK